MAKKIEETEEVSSPMGSLEKIKTIHDAPLPNGKLPIKQTIKPIWFTNWSDEDIGLWWDSKEYIYEARSRAPVAVGSPRENQEIRKKWALDLATREWYKKNPSKTGIDAKSRSPRDAELVEYVQKALMENFETKDVMLGDEKDLDIRKDYHVMKDVSAFAELSPQG